MTISLPGTGLSGPSSAPLHHQRAGKENLNYSTTKKSTNCCYWLMRRGVATGQNQNSSFLKIDHMAYFWVQSWAVLLYLQTDRQTDRWLRWVMTGFFGVIPLTATRGSQSSSRTPSGLFWRNRKWHVLHLKQKTDCPTFPFKTNRCSCVSLIQSGSKSTLPTPARPGEGGLTWRGRSCRCERSRGRAGRRGLGHITENRWTKELWSREQLESDSSPLLWQQSPANYPIFIIQRAFSRDQPD